MRKDTATQTRKSDAARRGGEALSLEGVDVHVPTRFCDIAGCSEGAEHRAPKSPGRLNDYFWFCLAPAEMTDGTSVVLGSGTILACSTMIPRWVKAGRTRSALRRIHPRLRPL
jgi:hypothetical protein